jgi:hypothetical protein
MINRSSNQTCPVTTTKLGIEIVGSLADNVAMAIREK